MSTASNDHYITITTAVLLSRHSHHYHPANCTYLPEDGLPGAVLQEGAVSCDGREQGLAGRLPNGRPAVHTQVTCRGGEVPYMLHAAG